MFFFSTEKEGKKKMEADVVNGILSIDPDISTNPIKKLEDVPIYVQIIIGVCSSIFGTAIAIALRQIKLLDAQKVVVLISITVQLVLSFGVFIGVSLFFRSGFIPKLVPSDIWSSLTVAYFLGAIPGIVVLWGLTLIDSLMQKKVKEKLGIELNPDNIESMSSFMSITKEHEVKQQDNKSKEEQ